MVVKCLLRPSPQGYKFEEEEEPVTSMKYWDDWVDADDMEAMWSHKDVHKEWIAAGETVGKKVHMLRNPEGRPYITPTEMQAVAEIVLDKHFHGRLNQAMICAIVEIESHRHPLAYHYNPKVKEAHSGLMRMRKSTVDWLIKEKGYTAYTVDWKSTLLFRPFVSVYYGAAYLKWLSSYEGRKRSEEFVVRAYLAGPKDVTSKATQNYWNNYLTAKQSLPLKWEASNSHVPPPLLIKESPSLGVAKKILYETSPGRKWIYWEEKTSAEDMCEMWRKSEVKKEWSKTGERPGRVRFSLDAEMRPHLKKVELKAVAEIIVERYFAERRISPSMLCTIAEITSKRLLFGEVSDGVMQIPFTTALWLYNNLGYKSYKMRSVDDLSKPFVSVYFGAAYICWLANYEGRTRSDQFIVQAYQSGPQCVDSRDAAPFWLTYIDNLPQYLATRKKKHHPRCCIQ